MSDPRSIMEGPPRDAFENSLLDAARGDSMPESSRARVLQALGVMPLVGAELACEPVSSAHATASMGLQPAVWGWGKVLGLVSVIVPAAAVGGWLLLSSAEEGKAPSAEASPSAQMPAASDASTPAPAAEPAAEPAVVALEDLPADEPSPASGQEAKAGRVSASAETPTTTGSLAEELGAIRDARSTLSAGRPAAALEQLDAYAAQYPRGRLRQEATVLRVEALLALGDRQQAERLAQPFLDQNSAYAARLRSLLAR